MALSSEQKLKVSRSVGRMIAGTIRLVAKTSKIVRQPPELEGMMKDQHPLIMACWHGQFMMLPLFDPGGVKVKAMVARHGDAELIGEAMRQFGVELIRGAGAGTRKKDRGGVHALRASVRALSKDEATVVMTADVPTGTPRRAGEGIVTIARLSGRPIVPVAAATKRYLTLKTWSRLTINLPFSKLALVAGEPIYVPREIDDAQLEHYRQQLEDSLNQATEEAYRLAGAETKRKTPKNTAATPPPKPGFLLKTYRRVTSLSRPAAALLLKIRQRKGKEIRTRSDERFGRATAARPRGTMVWFHAASVGETNAILPLMQEMEKRRPDLMFLLTTGTVTSAKLADQRLSPRAIHQFVPLDTAKYAKNFIQHWNPDLAIFTESEIWPNLILETEAARVPLVLVNARMSERSYKRWAKALGFSRPLFARFTKVLAQNAQIARWFSELGARDVINTGNLKIDSPPPPVDDATLKQLTSHLGDRPHFVCASTHDGEDEILINAHIKLAERLGNVCTIIAPRHPERSAKIAELVEAKALKGALRSKGELPQADTDIYIADTIGELGTFYKLSPIAFIGGSLIRHGGQNPIEAVRHGAAILSGPSQTNFQDAYRTLEHHQAMHTVTTADDIASKVAALLEDETEITRMQSGAVDALASLEGALEKTLDALLPLLPETVGLKRAS